MINFYDIDERPNIFRVTPALKQQDSPLHRVSQSNIWQHYINDYKITILIVEQKQIKPRSFRGKSKGLH